MWNTSALFLCRRHRSLLALELTSVSADSRSAGASRVSRPEPIPSGGDLLVCHQRILLSYGLQRASAYAGGVYGRAPGGCLEPGVKVPLPLVSLYYTWF